MNRLERLFAITELIRHSGRQPVTTARLADRFEVSTRTIERDLASLREAGAPLVSEAGRSGGTVSLDTATGAVVSLTATQVTGLLMAVAVAGSDMPYALDAQAGAAALLDGLAANTRATADELRGRIRNPQTLPTVSARIRRTVEAAVARGLVVNIKYRAADGTNSERGVEAVGFYLGSDGWYLNGWCRLRDDRRLFRLDRIEAAHLTRSQISDRNVDEVLGWIPSQANMP